MTDPDKERGLYNKYRVRKIDKDDPTLDHEVGQCFVLTENDRFAPDALFCYANACEDDYPLLAADLRALAGRWKATFEENSGG